MIVRRSRPMRARQRGAVALIFVVLFLVIVGYAAITASTLVSTGLNESNAGDDAFEADLLAESALERAFKLAKTGTACTNLGSDPVQTYGTGTFDITGGVLTGTECHVTVTGQVGSLTRTLQGVIIPNYSYTITFPNSSDFTTNWATQVLTFSGGAAAYATATCSLATCGISGGGSIRVQTNNSVSNERFAGYRQRDMASPLSTGSGMDLRWQFGVRKWTASGTATRHDIGISLVESSTGFETVLTVDTQKRRDNVFYLVSGTTTLPADRTYDRIRVNFDIQENGSSRVRAYLDAIQLNWP